MCALAAQFLGAGRNKNDCSYHDWTSFNGKFLTLTGDIAEGRAHYDQAIAFMIPTRTFLLQPVLGKTSGCQTSPFDLWLFLVGYPASA